MSKRKAIETQGEEVNSEAPGEVEQGESKAPSTKEGEEVKTEPPTDDGPTMPSSEVPKPGTTEEKQLVQEASQKLAMYALEQAKKVPAVEALPAVWNAVEAVPATRELMLLAIQAAMPQAWQTQAVRHWLESVSDATLRAVLSVGAAFWALGHAAGKRQGK